MWKPLTHTQVYQLSKQRETEIISYQIAMCPNRHTKTRLLCVCVWGEREKTKQKTTIVTSIPAIINVLNAIVEKMNSSHFTSYHPPTEEGRRTINLWVRQVQVVWHGDRKCHPHH